MYALPKAGCELGKIADDAAEFCRSNGLTEYLNIACDLINQHFETTGAAVVRKQEDPETPDEWVSISITAVGDADSILDAYDRYTDVWVGSVPNEVRSKIRLSLGAA